MAYIYIFIGGGIGASLRHLLSSLMHKPNAEFPIAILLINIIGSLLIGILAGKTNPDLQLFLIVGLLGGFTTFSAFSLEAIQLIQHGKYAYAAIYISASVAFSIGACLAGLMVAK